MVLLMAAEIERELISQRTKEALARRKADVTGVRWAWVCLHLWHFPSGFAPRTFNLGSDVPCCMSYRHKA
jgi:hypothetical protein